ncbi:hypothetical protein JFL43_19915 [Viridibacillus sp. YIM B01967]|uniref:YhfM-like domain-containing protein n=1 Tax=Viridibacillus soli TaxID=2798301 RepID=A0ABS1HCK5_9BACL|nr:hypothetical protein [Viridibacillus soli]MBK3497061.1 hypothetical protein [Viridibacillus soli]
MKFTKTLFVSLAMILFVITGCSNGIEDEGENIEVEKRIGNENKYEEFKEINDNKQVQKVKDILDEFDWENAKVDMERPADYHFWFRFKSSKMSAKAVLYEIWISPNKDKVEVVRGENQYVQLNVENSTDLFEILTGEKLSDL